LESAATGLAIGLYLALERSTGAPAEPFPATTALGALMRHLVESDPKHFQPANINYGLFEELPHRVKKVDKRAALADRAHEALTAWAARHGVAIDREKLEGAPVACAP
jgi:methylenetetrahydrofolate--tRNA-(uracil-5-)-methyltransferase